MKSPQFFIVGGCVRDRRLGLAPHDFDVVVVGHTIKTFLEEFPEAKLVGASFPVFLVNGEEFALARSERSTGRGHTDFEVTFDATVTLQEDLERRDLTINSGAECVDTGELTADPRFLDDLQNRILRHTGPAFCDDPLRVFRVARFAAQFPDFTVAPETLEVMSRMHDALEALPGERVFAELYRALNAKAPRRFFDVLKEAKVLDVFFPELAALIGIPAGPALHHPEVDTFEHTMQVTHKVKGSIQRFAALCHDFGKALTPPEELPTHHGHDERGVPLVEAFCKRLHVSSSHRSLAVLVTAQHMRVHTCLEMRAGKAVRLVREIIRKVGGFHDFLAVIEADGWDGKEEFLRRAFKVLRVRLPSKYRNSPPATIIGVITSLRAHAWKKI